MGEAGEGQNITHQQKKMGEDVLRAFRDRFGIELADDKIAEVPFLKLPAGGPEEKYLQERRAALGGALPVRRQKSRVAAGAGAVGVRRPAQADRGPRDLHDDGLRPDPDHPVAGQGDRQARGADRARRVAHVRHGGPVPAVRDLLPGRAALPARGRQAADVLQGVPHRADAAGGHQRGRRHVVLDRRGHLVLGVRRADDPVLHLLLDVRLPADRRPGLGGRRLAGPRLPGRRHRRADHAERRGPAARGRAQPPDVGHHPELRLLRPHLRPRGRGDRAGRAAPDVRRAGGRLLLPDGDERELPAPGHARGPGGRGPRGHHPRHVPAAGGDGREEGRTPGAAAGLAAPSCAR